MKFIDALAAVTQDDLNEVNTTIEELENQLSGLKRARGVILSALGKAPKRSGAVKGRVSKSLDDTFTVDSAPLTKLDEYRQAVYRYLAANGPQQQATLAKRCNIPSGSMTAVVGHKWFVVTSRGVELKQ